MTTFQKGVLCGDVCGYLSKRDWLGAVIVPVIFAIGCVVFNRVWPGRDDAA